ncbi:MAG: succinyl-diaminopimelate desuccinylase [Cardiobacteriaceae bacterium]|nr:succinyl-diaminopimelate desuccinylase [Cardiobacteriaceae bacterium]
MAAFTADSLLQTLIARKSITPDDAGCQQILAETLAPHGFACRQIDLGDTKNLWATHGSGAPVIAFAGHTDVVPPGNPADWASDPFVPTVRDGMIYGRGASDMKSGVAAMTLALATLAEQYPDHPGTLALLVTSDEEGVATHGIQAVLPILESEGTHIDYAIVGEPTASAELGDAARNGRRGSLTLTLTVHGIQGHVAYPEKVKNPVHALAAILAELASIRWDGGNAHFPPTSMQVSNVQAGTGVDNVVPATAMAIVNWRFNTEHTAASLREQAEAIAERHSASLGCRNTCQWYLSGEPFVTELGVLTEAVARASLAHTGKTLIFNTAGGTSDARFLAKYGTATVEYGGSNATIHKVNECVPQGESDRLAAIYHDSIVHLWQRLAAEGQRKTE